MPGWHAKTDALVKSGQLQVAGIVQEQHPDRGVLFQQWKKMSWPVLADSYNELGIKVVPITLLIDESGVIRFRNPKPGDFKNFMETNYPRGTVSKRIPAGIFRVKELEKLARDEAKNAVAHFQLGVGYRKRFDGGSGAPGDFAKAISSWEQALALDPDQYIWRRRIQQYGPRLDKPYSFYDWVIQAREEIRARGEVPHPLAAEPGGAEFAKPGQGDAAVASGHPDPEGKVARDESGLLGVESVVVASTKGDGKAVRVYLRFRPNALKDVHWSNEAGNLTFFPEGDAIFTDQDGPGKVPASPSSSEARRVEFEVRPEAGKSLPDQIKGVAFYFVCEGEAGVCRFLRQDLVISLLP